MKPSCADCENHTTINDDRGIDCLALERPTMDPATCPKFEPITEHKTICDACELEIEDNQVDVGHDCNLHEWCIAVEEIPREQLEQKYIDKIIECARLVDQHQELQLDANRYRWLRSRDLDTIDKGGVFAGMTPDNFVLADTELDAAIDQAIEKQPR